MSHGTTFRRITLQVMGDVTVVGFVDSKVVIDRLIRELGIELRSLVSDPATRLVVIDFAAVEFFSSAALQMLIGLDQAIKRAEGRLVLCGMRREIYEVFAITRLYRVFTIVDDLETALEKAHQC